MDLLFFFCYIQCVFDYEEVKYIEFEFLMKYLVMLDIQFLLLFDKKIMDSSFM